MTRTLYSAIRRLTAAVAAAAIVAAAFTPQPTSAAALTQKSDSFLAHAAAHSSRVGVIVALSSGGSPTELRGLQSLGCDVYRHLPIIRSLAMTVPSRNLAKLAALPYVTRISTDISAKKTDEFTDDNSGATAAFESSGLTGAGVTVAVLDSGIHQAADFQNGALLLPQSRILANVNFVPTTENPAESVRFALSVGSCCLTLNLTDRVDPAEDTCGHGTHVAGILAGNGASSSLLCFRTFTGIAPKANLVNVRVLDGDGVGDVSNVIAGVQWIIDHRAQYNIRVLNCSLGHPPGESYTTDPLCQAMEQAWKAGIVVVCAAGNDGRVNDNYTTAGMNNEGFGTNYGSILAPGNDPYVITVGAMKQEDANKADDRIATYSSRGPSRLDLILKPDVVAPGNRIISVEATGSSLAVNCGSTNQVPYGSYEDVTVTPSRSSNNYFILSGTSMACPVVAGAAALLLQANPNLSPDTIKARLMISADKWTQPDGSADPLTFGAGYVDIPAALKSTVVATEPALSPQLSVDSSGNVTIVEDGTVWSTHAIWGTSIDSASCVYGTHAIWGENCVSDDHAIWGENSVWDNHAIWDSCTNSVDLSSVAINGE